MTDQGRLGRRCPRGCSWPFVERGRHAPVDTIVLAVLAGLPEQAVPPAGPELGDVFTGREGAAWRATGGCQYQSHCATLDDRAGVLGEEPCSALPAPTRQAGLHRKPELTTVKEQQQAGALGLRSATGLVVASRT
jgi:hypothetical protein